MWPDPVWYYRNYMLFKLRQKGQEYDIKEIFDLNVYGLDPKRASAVIVDIGASIGDTLMFFAMKYPRAKLFAFEPNPEVFAYIQHNLDHVDTTGNAVHLYNKAVSHSGQRQIDFYLASDKLTPSWSSTFKDILPVEDVKKIYKVPAISFRSMLSVTGTIDLLKVDIEGGEYDLIPDIIRYSAKIESFVIEMHNFGEPKKRRILFEQLNNLSKKYALYMGPDYYHTMMQQVFDPKKEFKGDLPNRFGFMLYGKRLKRK